MSETQQRNSVVCDECGEQATLERNGYRRLFVSCACEESRSVKVSKATPMEWD